VRHEHRDARLVVAQRRAICKAAAPGRRRMQDDVERPVGPAWWIARITASESSRSM